MAKAITKKIKLQIPAGKATPAPPVGTVLGPAGINLQEFCTKFNDATKDKMGDVLPVEISIYEDEEKSELIYSGLLPFEPEVPVCFTSLMFVADVGTELTLVSETGVEKTVLDDFLNTTEGMSYVSNGYNDDSTFSTAGLSDFLFNGISASTLYISSNHWIGFGANTSQLYVMQRDGCSTAIWRQEGTCGNGVKFLKIRQGDWQ